MAVKSILDVDVQQQSFERFLNLWNEYQEQLKKQPEIWTKISAIQAKAAGGLAEYKATTEAHISNLREAQEAAEAQNKDLMRSHSIWQGIEGASRSTASHVKDMTLSMLKWTGLLSGLGALTSYFSIAGLMGLGTDVYGWRKSSMGLGVTSGQQRAFDISFGRLLGSPEGFLGGINTAVSNLSMQAPLLSLGVNPNQSTSQVAIDTLQALRTKALTTPTNQLGIMEQMYQLGNLGISVEDLRRLQSMRGGEFNQLLGTYGAQQRGLGLNDRTQKAWTDFVMSMDVAKSRIENVFVSGLAPLTPSIAHLAGSFADLLAKLMKGQGLSNIIKDVSTWMDKFSGEIKKPEFIGSLQKLATEAEAAADALAPIGKVLGWTGSAFHWTGTAIGTAAGATVVGAETWWNKLRTLFNPQAFNQAQSEKYMQMSAQMDARYGLPAGTLGLVGMLESGMNPNSPDSARGAIGMMQLMPRVAAAYGVNPHDPTESLEGAGALMHHLQNEYGGDMAKIFAAYNWGEGNLNKDIALRGSNWETGLPAETLRYVLRAIQAALAGAIKVDLKNGTGGSVAASISGLGSTR